MNIADTIVAKSDQLNADDLVGGPITVKVESVTRGAADQPVVVRISGAHCPWRPCKTSRRVLVAAWGAETDAWLGRWLKLYRDNTVKWAGEEVGGIRIEAMSDIPAQGLTLSLAVSKGKKTAHRVKFLKAEAQHQDGKSTARLDAVLADNDLAIEDFDRWRAAEGKPGFNDLDDDQRARIAAWLAGDPTRFNPIRALIPASTDEVP